MAYKNIELGVDVNNFSFAVYYWQSRDSSFNEHVQCLDQWRFWCCLEIGKEMPVAWDKHVPFTQIKSIGTDLEMNEQTIT